MGQMFKAMFTGIIVIMLMVGLIVSGCGTGARGSEQGKEPTPGEETPDNSEGAVNYEIIQEEDYGEELPLVVQEEIALLRKEKGIFIFAPPAYEMDDGIYLLISAGEKPTGGYALTLYSLKKQNNNLFVQVVEKTPAKNEIVIQVLTYPTLLLKLDRTYESYSVTSTDNVTYPTLSPESLSQRQEARGTYNGQIDGNFIEISVNGTPGAYLLPQTLAWVLADLVNEGDEVVFTYIENNFGQHIILQLDKN